MEKIYLKIVALFLACVLCFSCMSGYAFAADSDTAADETITEDSDTVTDETVTEDSDTVTDETITEDSDTAAGETVTEDSDTVTGETVTEDSDTAAGETVTENSDTVSGETVTEDSDTVTGETEAEEESWGSAPVLTGTTVTTDGYIKITWNALDNASVYTVMRRTADGSWTDLVTTSDTSYTDNTSFTYGETYYYSVKAYNESADSESGNTSSSWSSYDETGLKVVYTETPALDSTVNVAAGMKVKWNAVSGASGYAVFRKTSGGSWTRVGTATSTSYTDKTVSEGTKYYYTVRAYIGDKDTALANTYSAEYWSGYDSSAVSGYFLKVPALKSVNAAATGRTVSWKAVSGAKGYAVLRKSDGGSWKIIDTTTSTSYKDTASLTNGKTYYYSVRAYRGSKSTALDNKYSALYWSYRDDDGIKIVYTKAPTIKSTANTASGIKLQWSSISGAAGYAVFRKPSGGSWTQIGTTTSTSYTDKTASYGKSYNYAVRAYRGSKKTALASGRNALYWSGYNTAGGSAVRLKAPTLKTKITALGSGRKISWKAVSGAKGYAVFRKAKGGSWKRIALTTSTSYKDTASLTNGTTYYYSVRAYRSSQSKALDNKYSAAYWSYYDAAGFVYLKSPTISSVSRSSSTVKIKWGAISGAKGYAVFRKESGGSWKRIAMTTDTSYTDKNTSSNKLYYYAVRAYRGSKSKALDNLQNAKYWSGYKSHICNYNQVTVIAGDSIMVGLYGTSYNGISKINISGSKYVVAAGSLNCNTMRTASRFSRGTGVQQMASYNPTRVYIMLGMNEVAWKSTSSIKKDYATLVKSIKKACPRAQIVVLALSPVTRSKASRSPGFSKSRTDNYNATIKAMAKENGCLFYDYTANFKDSSGYLKQSFSGGDGIHWNSSAYAEFGRAISAYDASLN